MAKRFWYFVISVIVGCLPVLFATIGGEYTFLDADSWPSQQTLADGFAISISTLSAIMLEFTALASGDSNLRFHGTVPVTLTHDNFLQYLMPSTLVVLFMGYGIFGYLKGIKSADVLDIVADNYNLLVALIVISAFCSIVFHLILGIRERRFPVRLAP